MKATTPAHAFAIVIVDELVRGGVEDACLAPGSRSAPLAMALAADRRIRLHVRVDERSAAFVALGLAKASGRPSVVVSTSGTAAANFHPAVLEAHHSRTPLIVITADRPPELRGTGANQTIDQLKLFGDAVRRFTEVGVPEASPDSVTYWRSLAARAYLDTTSSPPGPVHLNVCFREPLTPEGAGWQYPLEGRAGDSPWTTLEPASGAVSNELVGELGAEISGTERGVIVAGGSRPAPPALLELAAVAAWPVLADPASGLRWGDNAVSTYDALLRVPEFARRASPDLVLRIGSSATSKATTAWMTVARNQILVDQDGWMLDPDRLVRRVFQADPGRLAERLVEKLVPRSRSQWLDEWLVAEDSARSAMDDAIDAHAVPTEPGIARDVAAAMPPGSTLVAASSMPVRDLDWFMAARSGLRVIGNRGVSGIDGLVSTAIGVAHASQSPVAALAGDLSMLHDLSGIGVLDGRVPDLTFVVVNNNGGGIFSFLPQARFPDSFEGIFGTPHGVHFEAVAEMFELAYEKIEVADEVAPALARSLQSGGIRILEVPTDRAANVGVHNEIWAAVRAALPRR